MTTDEMVKNLRPRTPPINKTNDNDIKIMTNDMYSYYYSKFFLIIGNIITVKLLLIIL